MRRLVRLLASCIAIFLIASFALASSPARASMNRPTWSTGDFWAYAIVSASRPSTPNGTFRMDVTGQESVDVNGTSYPSYHVAASLKIPFGGGFSFELPTPADIWFSTDTLAIVKIRAVIPPFANFTTQTTITIAGKPPQTIQWPLTAGATWSSSTLVWTTSTNATKTTYSSASLTTTFAVQADATITVPAGTFTTTPLKETTMGNYTMNFWSAQVGNWVRVGSYDNRQRNTQNFNLTSYSYAGGNFLTSIVLGLPVWIWLILLIVIIVAIIGFFAVRRRRPPAVMPPQMPPQEPPMGP